MWSEEKLSKMVMLNLICVDARLLACGDDEAQDGHHAGDKRKHSEAAAGDDKRTENIIHVDQVEDHPSAGASAPRQAK